VSGHIGLDLCPLYEISLGLTMTLHERNGADVNEQEFLSLQLDDVCCGM